jgi:hypothetical protein
VKIASGHVQPAHDIRVARVFFKKGGIAEAFLRFAACFLWRHSGSEVVRSAHCEVRAHLFVEVLIQVFSPQHASQARD